MLLHMILNIVLIGLLIQTSSPGGWVLENVKKFYAQNDTVFKIELNNHLTHFLEYLP